MVMSKFDHTQVLKKSFDEVNEALKVIGVGGTFVPEKFDEILLSYIVAGNGVGELGEATYKLEGVGLVTLTLEYDGSNRLIRVIRT